LIRRASVGTAWTDIKKTCANKVIKNKSPAGVSVDIDVAGERKAADPNRTGRLQPRNIDAARTPLIDDRDYPI